MVAHVTRRPAFQRRPLALGTVVLAVAVMCQARPNAQDEPKWGGPVMTLRASAVAQLIGEIAGYPVRVTGARIVWVIDSRALVIESDSRIEALPGSRSRVLVLVERGTLAIPRPPVATAPITITGQASTLLGIQAGRGVDWPPALTHELVDRLEIRAAILASSVQTPERVELTID
jgi:hypothetical protein